MINCEESSCENFQSAICLHCMQRLCIYHIGDHQKILLNQIDELNNQANQVNIVLINASNMMVKERMADEKKCNDWRQQKIAEIEQEYNKMMHSINNRQKTLEQLELELNQRLKVKIQQPLEHICIQKSINPYLLDTIQSAIETIRRDSEFLVWNSQHSDNINNSSSSKQDEKETTSSTLPKVKRLKEKKIKTWKPRNHFFSLFRDVGRGSTDKIHQFLQTMKDEDKIENYGLITLIFSYLQTWYQTKAERGKHKQLILNKHISTIKQYINGKDCERKALIALEFFYNNLKQKGQLEIEMMTMLLQLFFDHQCISISEMIDWYLNENFIDKIIGKNLEKKWAEPFLNRHGCQIKSANPSSNEITNTTFSSCETLSMNTENNSTLKHVCIRKPFRNLVKLFKNQSNTNDMTIHEYIKMQYGKNMDGRVIMIVRCYLKAWNDCESSTKNEFLFNNVVFIKYYESDPDFEMQIMFAIEIFLSQNKNNENWSIETISTLFQLFLDQNCIKKETILKWNSDGHFYNDIYYKETKHFAQPFIQRLITSN